MNELEKLLRKANKYDRETLLVFLKDLQKGNLEGVDIKKLQGTPNAFRARKGDFRVLFELRDEKVFIKNVKRRNEKTYKEY